MMVRAPDVRVWRRFDLFLDASQGMIPANLLDPVAVIRSKGRCQVASGQSSASSVAWHVVFFAAGPLFAEDGPTLYKQLCASCHDTGTDRAPESRRAAGDVARARARRARKRGHALDGQRPHGRRAPRDRRIRHRQVVRAGVQHDAVAAGDVSRDGRRLRQPAGGTALERLGREHGEHALSGRRAGRIHGGRRAAAEAEVGLRLSRRAQRRCAADDRRRPRVRRHAERHRLCARAPPRAASTGRSRPTPPCAPR